MDVSRFAAPNEHSDYRRRRLAAQSRLALQDVWLPAFARAANASAPPKISEQDALATPGPDAVYYATRLRGASNEKARRTLNFRPRRLEWL